jgi:hypothetical protein
MLKDKVKTETQCFVVLPLPTLDPDVVVIIANFVATPLPVFVMDQRFGQRFHSLLVQRLSFVLLTPTVTKLTILNLTVPRFLPLLTVKLNHWV